MHRLLRITYLVPIYMIACSVSTVSDDDSAAATTGPATGVGGSSSSVGSVGVGGSMPSGEQGKMVGFTEAHNEVRRPLGLTDLSWDESVAVVAQAYAEKLASENCAFYHSMHPDYGENLYWSQGLMPTPQDVTAAWASEVQFYDYESNSCQPGEQCGHYTQIVWATTERLGCGMAHCADNAEVWVCNYDPPGNWVGQRPY